MKGTMRTFRLSAFPLSVFLCCALAHAAGFGVELKVTDGKATQSNKSKPPAAADQMVRRMTLETSINAPLSASWKVTRSDPTEAQDVLVHFVVVKLDKQGQAVPALEPDKVPIECALTMDFPKDKTATGTQPFHVDAPGIYLVRIEAGGDPDKPGQEDFAEIELVVK